jgi:glyoxylase-like metal-dependent hydrolase (beta-lactamase superfamily II)
MGVPPDIAVLVRGWLHGNVVRVGRTVVDSGYHTGAGALLDFAGDCDRVVLTHAHSDHAGGVARLVEHFECRVWAHADVAGLCEQWDRRELWLEGTGQELPRFSVDEVLGSTVELGDEAWRVVDTPGHAVGGVSFFRERDGVLISGDALWEDGFGLLNTWYDPPGVFERTEQALDNLAALEVAVVVPGHGEPFTAFEDALDRARGRLRYLRANPERHRAQVVRNLLGFWALAAPPADASEAEARRAAAEARFYR